MLFPKGAILECMTLLKLNNLAADKGKSLIYKVFSEAKMILFCVYAEFCIK